MILIYLEKIPHVDVVAALYRTQIITQISRDSPDALSGECRIKLYCSQHAREAQSEEKQRRRETRLRTHNNLFLEYKNKFTK